MDDETLKTGPGAEAPEGLEPVYEWRLQRDGTWEKVQRASDWTATTNAYVNRLITMNRVAIMRHRVESARILARVRAMRRSMRRPAFRRIH
jgi:hypothetical protein